MIRTGLKALDNVLGGGFPEKTNTLLSGSPGTGKTILGLKFLLEGAENGDKCCYISLNEDKEGILRTCDGIESLRGVRNYIDKNFIVEHITLGETITMKKFIEILAQYPKIDRLVIDNVNKLLIFSENKKSYRINLSEMIKHLRNISNCTLIICETHDKTDLGNGEAFECDGVIQLSFLDYEEKPMRVLRVHKMRYASFDAKVPHEMIINSKGISLGDTKII